MDGYFSNIEIETLKNENFRKVLYTGPNMQLVVMSLRPGEDIGAEVHDHIDQFIRVENGIGQILIGEEKHIIENDYCAIVPAGMTHNVINTSDTEEMKLYTIYTPAEHRDGTIHRTKAEAEEAHHH